MPFLESSQYLRPLLVTNLPLKGRKYRIIPLLQDCLHVRKHIFVNRHCVCAQLCPTLCDPVACSLPGSPVHGISQARILEWAAIPFSRDLSDPGIKPASPVSLALQADSLLLSHGEVVRHCVCN